MTQSRKQQICLEETPYIAFPAAFVVLFCVVKMG
jgi:hypothetical protein